MPKRDKTPEEIVREARAQWQESQRIVRQYATPQQREDAGRAIEILKALRAQQQPTQPQRQLTNPRDLLLRYEIKLMEAIVALQGIDPEEGFQQLEALLRWTQQLIQDLDNLNNNKGARR